MHGTEERIRPAGIIGNVYFVGGRAVSVHVVDTGEGLIMIDTGYPFMRDEILSNMREVGLDPMDLRIILHSHGHYDHIGNTVFFRALTGAETCISRIDNSICTGERDLSWAAELGCERLPEFSCDRLLEDGDIVSLGNTHIRCLSAPGHTQGTMAFIFDTGDSGRRFTCAMHGGIGMNSMAADYLDKYGLSYDCREQFRRGLHRLASERVDVVLGNHPDQNDTEDKVKRLLSGDGYAFVDEGEWQRLLRKCESRLDDMLAAEAQKGEGSKSE